MTPRIRLAALALFAAAVMFLLYPAVRPWTDESVLHGATDAFSSGAWVASHLFAMIGFILIPLGLLGLRAVLARTSAEPVVSAGIVASWVGAGLTLPYYGAEDFALNVLGEKAAAGETLDLLDLTEAIRFEPAAVTTFALGLLLLGVGAVLIAVATRRTTTLPNAAGGLFALGMALFIPQFYAPAEVRIAHGAVIAIGLAWMAWGLWRLPASAEADLPASGQRTS